MDHYVLEKLTGWTPELSPPPDSPLYRWRPLAGEFGTWRVAVLEPSFRGDAEHRTRNLEMPGLVLRTVPE